MRVPINPQTNVPQGQLGYEKPVDISAGTRALGEVVSKWGEYAEQQAKKRELFDVEQKSVDELNAMEVDFAEKKKVQPLGAPNFVQQVNGEYNTRHMQMVKALKDQGYSPEALQEFGQRLGTYRAQFVARAIDFETKSNFSKTVNDANQMTISLSQYAQANDNGTESALHSLRTGLSYSGLEQPEQEQIYNVKKGEIIRAGQEGFALRHPEVVFGLYGLGRSIANSPDGTSTTISTEAIPPNGQLADNIVAGLKNRGLSDHVARGVAAGIFSESANKVDAFNKAGGGNGAFGLGQWRGARQAALFAKYGRNPTGHQQLDFLVSELNGGDAGGKAVLSQADEVAVLHSYVHDFMRPSEAGAKGDISRGLAALGRKVAEHADRTEAALKPIPTNWRGNQEDAIQELGMTADQAKTFLETGKDTRGAPVAQPVVQFDASGKTGIPVIDLASGTERLQMLTLARTVMNEREADAKSAANAAHEQWYNGFLNQLQDGKLGQADLNAAYAGGQITDFDERKKAQAIIDGKIKKNDDLARFQVMLASGQKFNPYDDNAQKAVDAGFEKAVEYSAKNGNFADPFTIALRAWQRTGILPKQGAVMLRGGLVGTNVAQVAASASVASNMLKQNPNAFAGVEGGKEIGEAAANYTHYVDDLGMTAQDAVNKIAQQNSPEFQAKQKADEPMRNAFVNSITGDKTHTGIDIEKTINDSIFGARGWGSTLTFHAFDPTRGTFNEPQKAEARQTYLELALDHFDKYHDPAAAQAYASRQMSRFYGVEGNRLVKYPATKAYPEIMGSTEYVFDQAKKLVDQITGLKVPKEDIFLQPTASGSTAAAFRAGQAPPYELHYITRENGQAVYHFIPGKVFVADLDEARRAAAIEARKVEAEARRREQSVRELAGQSYAH